MDGATANHFDAGGRHETLRGPQHYLHLVAGDRRQRPGDDAHI